MVSEDRFTARASFTGVPAGGQFDSVVPIPDTYGKTALGVDRYSKGGLEAKLQYNAEFAENFVSQYGSVPVSHTL